MVRVWLLILSVLGAACTPEAIVVDPQMEGGSGESSGSSGAPSGGGSSGNTAGSNASQAGDASSSVCAELESPKDDCAACLAKECAAEVEACRGTPCLCGESGDATGQFNCLLACPTIKPEMEEVDACAKQCGFDGLRGSDQRTHALFDCAVDAPNMGPPVCPVCFGLPQP